MTTARRLLELPLRTLVRVLLVCLPRDPQRVVMGAVDNRFIDNAAYLYLRAAARRGRLRVCWVTGSAAVAASLRSRGLPVVRRRSVRGAWACVRAGWYVYSSYPSDISRWWYDGARLLNLWHGAGTKFIERQVDVGLTGVIHRRRGWWSPLRWAFVDDRRKPHYVLAPSAAVAERVLAPGFGVGIDRCLLAGYPRLDHFNGVQVPHADLLSNQERVRQARDAAFAVGYFPTWRDDGSDFLALAGMSPGSFADALSEIGAALIFKPHFNTLTTTSTSGAITLERNDDVSMYLPLCDVLVTDYSTIALDFLLLDRPIIYFVPDYEAYRAQRRSPFTPDELMPGPIARTFPELIAELRRALNGVDEHHSARAAAASLFWAASAGGASETLLSFLEEPH